MNVLQRAGDMPLLVKKINKMGHYAVLLTRTLEQGPGQGQGLESVITQNAK